MLWDLDLLIQSLDLDLDLDLSLNLDRCLVFLTRI